MEGLYEIKVENIFEGPMGLLVHLIKRNEVDIWDIPIAMITAQYLEFLEWMKSMNIDFAGDFILMASILTQIKSKMLVPTHDENGKIEDPRLEIARPLAEYLQMRSVAEQLTERELLGEDVFPIGPAREEFLLVRNDEGMIKADLFELIEAFRRILEKMPGDHRVELGVERFSIKDKITEITDILEQEGSVTFDSLFSRNSDKSEMIVTFLAILEMAKLCLLRITQQAQAGVIRLFYL